MIVVAIYTVFEDTITITLSGQKTAKEAIIEACIAEHGKEMHEDDLDDWKIRLDAIGSEKELIADLREAELVVTYTIY